MTAENVTDMPEITGSVYMAQSVDPSHCGQVGMTLTGGHAGGQSGDLVMPEMTRFEYPEAQPWPTVPDDMQKAYESHEAKLQEQLEERFYDREEEEEEMPKKRVRLVHVFICDPDPRVPDEKGLLWCTEKPIRTYLTNDELAYELPIDVRELCKEWNVERAKIIDKDMTREHGRDIFLEEIRPKDLWIHAGEVGGK